MNYPTEGSKTYYKKRIINTVYKKYGNDFFTMLYKFESGDYVITLSLIAKKFGISRERVRQIYNILYNKGARTVKKCLPNDITTCVNDPRHKIAEHSKNSFTYKGAIKEKEFWDECTKRGFNCIPECAECVDFNVNGNLVDVKSRSNSKITNGGKTPIAQFCVKKNQYNVADFFACWHPTLKCWFIIPKKEILTKTHAICISNGSKYHTAKNKYHEFKEAWHLLK